MTEVERKLVEQNRKLRAQNADLRARYLKLREGAAKQAGSYARLRLAYLKLRAASLRIRSTYLLLRKHAGEQVRALVDELRRDRFSLVVDERRRIRSLSPELLELLGLSKQGFEPYLELLFERYLPIPDRSRRTQPVVAFRLPVFVGGSGGSGGEESYPFVHLELSGRAERSADGPEFLYYLSAEDVTSEVELEYYQKTDASIRKLASANARLERARRTIELHKAMLISLTCSLVGEYSKETSRHLGNVRELSACLARECQALGLIRVEGWDPADYAKELAFTSVLHDIGKMAVPVWILGKDGPLTEEERELMRRHPQVGASYFDKIVSSFEFDPAYAEAIRYLSLPRDICLRHHERWDGRGYPEGLSGESIPLAARIVAVVDAYEAMRGTRGYNHARRSHEEALAVIRAESGKQFDPAVVEALENVGGLFAELYKPE